MATLHLYKSYNFRNQDPVVDKLRTIKSDTKFTDEEIHERSGVSVGTLYRWWNRQTRRPQHATIMAVARAMGYDYELVKKNGGSKVKPT